MVCSLVSAVEEDSEKEKAREQIKSSVCALRESQSVKKEMRALCLRGA